MRNLLKVLLLCIFLSTVAHARAERFPSGVTIIKADQFLGRPYFSVADALEGTGVVDMEQAGSRGTRAVPRLRGLSSAHDVLVLLDGVSLNPNFNSQVDLSKIPLNIVDRIEITKGGAASIYAPGALAGVIHIITSRPMDQGLSTRLGTGIGRDGVQQHHGRFLSRNYFGDLTYLTSRLDSSGYTTNDSSEDTNHFFNFTRSFNGDGFWGAEYFYQDTSEGLSNGTSVPMDQWNTRLEREARDNFSFRKEETQHLKFILNSPRVFGGRIHSSVFHGFRQTDGHAQKNGPSLLSIDNETTGVTFSYRSGDFEAGGEAETFTREYFPEPIRESSQTGFFIRSQWRKGDIILLPGARADYHSKAGSVFSPRLVMLVELSSATVLSLSAQRGVRFPGLDELYNSSGTVGSTSLNPEKSWSYDGGVEWSPAGWLSLQGTSFFIKKIDSIRLDAPSRQFQNQTAERSEGVEGNITLGRRLARLQIRGTRLRSIQQQTNGEQLDSPLTPREHLFTSLDLFLPKGLTLTNEYKYQSEQFEGAGRTGLRLPGFYTWNIRFLFHFLKAHAYFQVDNITQRRYADALSGSPTAPAPQPARTYWTGITIHFKN